MLWEDGIFPNEVKGFEGSRLIAVKRVAFDHPYRAPVP